MERESYSDLITPLGDNISAEGTQIHVFYAMKMGEKYRLRYLQHFADPDIIEQDYGHEEMLFFYPENWAEEIKNVRVYSMAIILEPSPKTTCKVSSSTRCARAEAFFSLV